MSPNQFSPVSANIRESFNLMMSYLDQYQSSGKAERKNFIPVIDEAFRQIQGRAGLTTEDLYRLRDRVQKINLDARKLDETLEKIERWSISELPH